MREGAKLTDAEHAKAVRDAVENFETAMREAAADGLVIMIEVSRRSGYERGADRSTRYQGITVKNIFRPI